MHAALCLHPSLSSRSLFLPPSDCGSLQNSLYQGFPHRAGSEGVVTDLGFSDRDGPGLITFEFSAKPSMSLYHIASERERTTSIEAELSAQRERAQQLQQIQQNLQQQLEQAQATTQLAQQHAERAMREAQEQRQMLHKGRGRDRSEKQGDECDRELARSWQRRHTSKLRNFMQPANGSSGPSTPAASPDGGEGGLGGWLERRKDVVGGAPGNGEIGDSLFDVEKA